MKKTSLVLAVVLGLFMLLTINAGTAFATNWVEIPGMASVYGPNHAVYVDADSAVKQGGKLIYWVMTVALKERSDGIGKMCQKFEIDLRTPHKHKELLFIRWDRNDNQLGQPYSNPIWSNGVPSGFDLALSLAKEGQDTETIPAPVSDR
jgi:hypothetical protein